MKTVIELLVLLLLLVSAGAQAATHEPPEEVVVGLQPGPPLWKVTNGANTLWIFPYLSVIPKDMVWESDRVARVIADSQEYIGMPHQEAGTSLLPMLNPANLLRGYRLVRRLQRNPDGSTLGEALSPHVYARYAALKARHFTGNDDLEELRPLFAGGRMAILIRDDVGLVERGEILDTIWKLARRNRGMKLTDISVDLAVEGNVTELADRAEAMLDNLSREQEQVCFDQRVRYFEENLNRIKVRANTWAQGLVTEFREVALVGAESNACMDAVVASSGQDTLVDMDARLDQMWLDAAQIALTNNASTFAVLNIDDLLRTDGPMSRLRSRGYEVREP